MQYRKLPHGGEQIGVLGLGSSAIGQAGDKEIEATVAMALENGVNYFDTAYGYHNGQSEVVTGKILSNYPRDSYYLASKFPGYDLANMGKVRQIFEEQLQKCGVDHFDFYLFHNVYERNIDPYLDEKNGILEYLLEQSDDPDRRCQLQDRIRMLSAMLREARELAVLTERYYDRGYHRNAKYTI